jgi:SAM-dependent methyltransferase
VTSGLNGYTPFASKKNFDAYLETIPGILERRREWSHRWFDVADPETDLEAWCSACCALTSFEKPDRSDQAIDFREGLKCHVCELNARARVVADLALAHSVGPGLVVPYATEQTSPFYRWLKRRFPAAIGSEYFDSREHDRLQDYVHHLIGPEEQLRYEDATQLRLADDSVDIVVTSDVLEHIPDHDRALREFYRIIRPGGRLIVTVPFGWDRGESLRRARLRQDGSIEHLLEPEYHGDPMSDSGVLAFHSFGWDLLDDVRAAGFEDARWVLVWRPVGLFLADLWVLVANARSGSD